MVRGQTFSSEPEQEGSHMKNHIHQNQAQTSHNPHLFGNSTHHSHAGIAGSYSSDINRPNTTGSLSALNHHHAPNSQSKNPEYLFPVKPHLRPEYGGQRYTVQGSFFNPNMNMRNHSSSFHNDDSLSEGGAYNMRNMRNSYIPQGSMIGKLDQQPGVIGRTSSDNSQKTVNQLSSANSSMNYAVSRPIEWNFNFKK